MNPNIEPMIQIMIFSFQAFEGREQMNQFIKFKFIITYAINLNKKFYLDFNFLLISDKAIHSFND